MKNDNSRQNFSTRLPVSLARKLEQEAAKQDRSVSYIIKLAVARHLGGERPPVEYREAL
jgi:hypothetical protein